MKKIIAAFAFLLTMAAVGSAQASWVGSYEFTESGGRTAGGTAIVITHEIDITQGEKGLVAMIQSNGYQTSSELVCTAKVEGGKLNIYFESYGENNMLEPYEAGDLLLSLENKMVKGKPQLLTWWGKFTPGYPANEKTGRFYFKKI
jgi:Family of unknown function (DUF5991)